MTSLFMTQLVEVSPFSSSRANGLLLQRLISYASCNALIKYKVNKRIKIKTACSNKCYLLSIFRLQRSHIQTYGDLIQSCAGKERAKECEGLELTMMH